MNKDDMALIGIAIAVANGHPDPKAYSMALVAAAYPAPELTEVVPEVPPDVPAQVF